MIEHAKALSLFSSRAERANPVSSGVMKKMILPKLNSHKANGGANNSLRGDLATDDVHFNYLMRRLPRLSERVESLGGFYLVLGTTRSSWSRGTCERLSGFYFVPGTTWASWSRDTCESLSGFYFVLGTTWASWSRGTCERLNGF